MLSKIEEVIEDIKNGKMIILLDDENRENAGDLVMAAELTTPETINFMTKYARGLICMPITQELAEQKELEMMKCTSEISTIYKPQERKWPDSTAHIAFPHSPSSF